MTRQERDNLDKAIQNSYEELNNLCEPTGLRTRCGERLFRNDGKKHIRFSLIKFIKCRGNHEYEHAEYSTGGGWMSEDHSCDICIHCGKRINWE